MKLKLDENGHVVVSDGKPVYIHDDGKEIPFDAAAAVVKIGQLNGEVKNHREAKEAAIERLKAFEGINDPAAALKALDIVANLDAKKLIDAGEVETIKKQAESAFEEKLTALEKKYAPIVKERDSLQQRLVAEKIGGAFSRSKYISDNLAIPADLVEARFGKAFRLEEDSVVAYDGQGKKIFSRMNPGEVAGFDEALELLVETYPHRDHILKGAGGNGGGAGGGAAGGSGKQISRAAFDAMPQSERSAKMKDGFRVVDA